MNLLTKQEQFILTLILGLFLLGLAVQAYRKANATPQPVQAAISSEAHGKQ